MNPLRSIIAATDFSVYGNNAVRRAALLARQQDACLKVLHVVDNATLPPVRDWFVLPHGLGARIAQAEQMLQRVVREVSEPSDRPAEIDVQAGDRVAALLRAAERADLLVLGQRSPNRLKDLLLLHTAHRVVERSRGPVLVVKKAVDAAYQHVLVPFDFTPVSESASMFAGSLAPDVELHFLHALYSRKDVELRHACVPDDVIRETLESEDQALVARMRCQLAGLVLASRDLQFRVERGLAEPTILEAELSSPIDLMVVGRARRSKTAEMLLGSVSYGLLEQTACDILVVPLDQVDQLPAAIRGGAESMGSPRLSNSTAAFARERQRAAECTIKQLRTRGLDIPIPH